MSSLTANVRPYSKSFPRRLLTLEIGCMESLVYYKRLILRVHHNKLDAGQRDVLRAECSRLLTTLQEIDPMRKHRYEDLGESRLLLNG